MCWGLRLSICSGQGTCSTCHVALRMRHLRHPLAMMIATQQQEQGQEQGQEEGQEGEGGKEAKDSEGGGGSGGATGSCDELTRAPTAIRFLYAALLTLCARSHDPSTIARLRADPGHWAEHAARLEQIQAAACRLDEYRTQCDPMVRLRRCLARARTAVAEALEDGLHYAVGRRGHGASGDGNDGDGNEDDGGDGDGGDDAGGGDDGGGGGSVGDADARLRVRVPQADGDSLWVSVACEQRPSDAAGARKIDAFAQRVLSALDRLDALRSVEATGEAGSAAGGHDAISGRFCGGGLEGMDSAGHLPGVVVECSRWGVLTFIERFVLGERLRMAELAARVVRRSASTAQRRTMVAGARATQPLRRLAALVLGLAERQPVRQVSSDGKAGSASCAAPTTAAAAAEAVPTSKLHALAQALCAMHEPGNAKGVEHAVALGTAFLDSRQVRRAIFG